MYPAQSCQLRVLERLYPQRQAVDTGGAKTGKLRGLCTAGIGFQCRLEVVGQRHPIGDAAHQAVNPRGTEQAGRAAPDEQGLHDAVLHEGQIRLQICQQCRNILGFRQRARLVGIEIAIGAFALAPGQVHVKAQRGELQCAHQPGGGGRLRSSAATSCAQATARWLTRFLVRGASCAALQLNAATWNNGS